MKTILLIVLIIVLPVMTAYLCDRMADPCSCTDEETELETPTNISACYAWAFKGRRTCGASPSACQRRHVTDMKLCSEHFKGVAP